MFGNIIRSFRLNNGLSQANFVDVIQRSHKNFNSLDIVTLSRWERGVTKPHLKRQNELLDIIGVNIFDVWETSDKNRIVKGLINKFNNNGYLDVNLKVDVDVNIINENNLYSLNNVLNLIDVIFEYEDNLIFLEMLSLGFSRKSIIEKIISQYSGELTLVTLNGQLIGHLLSSNYRLLSDFLKKDLIATNINIHLVVTFNCTHFSSFISTMGREGYKYLQNLNPNTLLYVCLKNKKMFDLFFSLGFEPRSIIKNDKTMKIMSLNSDGMKSQRTWMDIITNYKGENYEENSTNC